MVPAPRSPLSVTLSVWKALFLREAVSRVSARRAAWMWLLVEPMAHVVFLMLLYTSIGSRAVPGTSYALFFMTGVIGYHFFQHAATKSIDAISANAALFSYRQVKPVDAVLVRAALESFIEFIVFILLCAGASFIGMDALPHDPLGAATALTLLAGLGVGLGLIFSVAAHLVPEIGKIVRLAFIPLYLMSGVVFPPTILPPSIREWLFLNPVMHGVEALREAFFRGYPTSPDLDLGYLAAWAVAAVFLGLTLHVRFAQRLTAQ